jgi:hypothetical protein
MVKVGMVLVTFGIAPIVLACALVGVTPWELW